jgi:ATP-binding cassette, subfamily B, bacterial MsbA
MTKNTANAPQHIDSSTWSLVRRIARDYLSRYKGKLAVAIFFMIVSALLTASFAKLIQPVLDNVLVNKREDLILPMASTVFVVFVGNGLSTYIHSVMLSIIGLSIVADVQRDLFSRFVDLDLRFFHENPSGHLISRMVNDVTAMRSAVTDTLTGFGESFLTLVFLVALMFYQDWQLALIAFCVFPPAGFFVSRIGRKLRRLSGGIQTEVGSLSHILSQIFQGVRQVKAYGMENYERERAGKAITMLRNMHFKGIRASNLSTPVNQSLLGFALFGVIVYGGYHITSGALTVGSLMSFIAAFSLAYEPLKRLSRLNNNLQMGLGAATRIFEMMDRQAAIVNKPGAKELKAARPDIVFEKVTFGYGFDEGHALDEVSFTVEAGKVTALVGPSGSGKTTAMNMVPRFYDAIGGRVLVGGEDVRDVTLESLRSHIALVSQDITIFDDTVRANIAYGRHGATEEEIMNAALMAAADEFIRNLPQGYDTRLGEHGVKLSGGQRQRIAIARAILRDAPILLLDEATSALDNESERAIQASLEKLQKGRTTLVIAHRLSTVQKADLIVVLDRGKVVESAGHEKLVSNDGLYARMHRMGISGRG